ncbi:hypothetical protein [Nonomuraea dietziae]|uniref:Uncharacterized protein n=1 Tax=Nonomuraea dietziae TaxID=65515 RepID=A0A7W5V1D1_9ACTN|nr:hypothetical protein [Nonomuraea dietziae]MBB3728596.1 hypothetical protein [Nonomuraea dietziae]
MNMTRPAPSTRPVVATPAAHTSGAPWRQAVIASHGGQALGPAHLRRDGDPDPALHAPVEVGEDREHLVTTNVDTHDPAPRRP